MDEMTDIQPAITTMDAIVQRIFELRGQTVQSGK